MGRSFVFYALASLAILFASACTPPQTSAQEADHVPTGPILSFANSGGCARGGHCTTTNVFLDGRFEITNWMRPSAPDYPIEGRVPNATIEDIMSHVEDLDWEAFTASLEPGKSAAPSDGVDIVVTLKADDKHIVLNSAQYRFYPNDDPLFQMIREVQQEVFSAQQTE